MNIPDLYQHLEDGTVNKVELQTLAALVQKKNPARILELGTFTGLSTLAMAIANPQAIIHTVDIDNDTHPEHADPADLYFIKRKRLGQHFKGTEYESRIVQFICDSTEFKPTVLYDFIFVDAAHSEYYVKADTLNAFRWLAPGGWIVFHDYDCCWPAVTHCIQELKESGLKITTCPLTSFAVYKSTTTK